MTDSSQSLICNGYDMVVDNITTIAKDVKHFIFKRVDGNQVFDISPGSHITLDLPLQDKLHKNTYTIVRRTHDGCGYEIAVLRNEDGRGGSKWMHDKLKEKDHLYISTPGNYFSPNLLAKHQILIAGGIGITPMISYIKAFEEIGMSWELHYGSRSEERMAFKDVLLAYGDKVKFYFGDKNQICDIHDVLTHRPAGTHVYVCGPQSMISATHDIAKKIGWPDTAVHSEAFAAAGGAPFTAILKKSGKIINVSDTQTLLEAIEDNGINVPNVCRGGGCGYCKTAVVEGIPEHRDFFLTDHEKEENGFIMPCVSRCKEEKITLDL